MQNIVINTCEKFHYDRLRNNEALGNRKSDNNKKNKNNVRGHWDPCPGPKKMNRLLQVLCEWMVVGGGTEMEMGHLS